MRQSAKPLTPDLCVIGAGSGGLSVAAGAVQMGASVVLVEPAEMGGDCLNAGCVPSKALIAAAGRAQAMRSASPFGIEAVEPAVDYAAVMGHVHETIAAIAPHDSQERFEGLGVTVIREHARFVSNRELVAGTTRVRARRYVVATGSRPAVPPIPGLDAVPYLTNGTLWDLREAPGHLLILGGGPIGMEMAQAHARLGVRVTVVEAARALGREDPDVAEIAVRRLRAEGIDLRERTAAERVSGRGGCVTLHLAGGERVEGTHLLVAVGRKPTVEGLGLEEAGVAHTAKGIEVTPGLRSTTNSRVYAIGDVTGGLQFTHVAGHQAGLVVRNALFRLPVRDRPGIVPMVTYTDPEVARVGMTAAEARDAQGDSVEVHDVPLSGNDRARAMRETDGLCRLVATGRGRILGAAIVAPHAGELIQPWALALSKGLSVKDMTGHIASYPTLGELSKQAAGAFYAKRLFQSATVRRVVRLLARLG